MALRKISDGEVVVGSPDSSFLATGIDNNLGENMRGGPPFNCGFFYYDQNNPAPNRHDLDGYANLLGSTISVLLLEKNIMIVPGGVTRILGTFFGSCATSDSNHFFRIHFYNLTTLVSKYYNIQYLPTTESLIEYSFGSLTGSANYRIRIYAFRLVTGAPRVVYTLKQASFRPVV